MRAAVEKVLLNIAELLKVKSLISIIIIYAITYGFIKGMVAPEMYGAFAGSIITYYFTRKDKKEDVF